MAPSSRFRDIIPPSPAPPFSARRGIPSASWAAHGKDALLLIHPLTGSVAIHGRGPTVIAPPRRWTLAWGPLARSLAAHGAALVDAVAIAVPVRAALAWWGVGQESVTMSSKERGAVSGKRTRADYREVPLRLMEGAAVVLDADLAHGVLAARWAREAGDARRRPLALLEIEALVRRAAAPRVATTDAPAIAASTSSSPSPGGARDARRFAAMRDALHRRIAGDARDSAVRSRVTLAEIARAAGAGMMPDTASRIFRRHAGCSVLAYQQRLRADRARALLVSGHLPIADIAARCGFHSLSRFYEAFTLACGETPARCRQRSAASQRARANGGGMTARGAPPSQPFVPLEINRQRDPQLLAHVHPHLELDFVFSGELRYTFAGRAVTVGARRWTLLWAALPHALLGCEPGTDALALAVPVAIACAWPGVAGLLERLRSGRAVALEADPADAALAERWMRDGGDPFLGPVVMLELEALVRRAAMRYATASPSRRAPPLDPGSATVVFGEMIAFLHQRLATTRSVAETAAAAGVAPALAARLFQLYLGCGIRGYQQRLRAAEARRLLAGTRLPIAEIALRCGFQSLSRFYAAYKRLFGETPAEIRKEPGEVRTEVPEE